MDFPTAWAYVRLTEPVDHHERCSWRTTNGALLCDCDVLDGEYARRAKARGYERVTHGRHCLCSSCAREDWTRELGPCGMHGPDCPGVYAPLGAVGSWVLPLASAVQRSRPDSEVDSGGAGVTGSTDG